MISAMAVPSFMAIPSPRPAVAGVGLLPIVGTGFYQSVKRGVRLAREVLICVPCLKSPGECAVLLHKDPSCPGLTGHPPRRGFSIPSQPSLEYWIARSSRAMTPESLARWCFTTTSAASRRDASEFLQKLFAQQNGGRRECRALDAPAASRAK